MPLRFRDVELHTRKVFFPYISSLYHHVNTVIPGSGLHLGSLVKTHVCLTYIREFRQPLAIEFWDA
jgi:hypothetical protein